MNNGTENCPEGVKISLQTVLLIFLFSSALLAYTYTLIFLYADPSQSYYFAGVLVGKALLQGPVKYISLKVRRLEHVIPRPSFVTKILPYVPDFECYMATSTIVSVGIILVLRVLNGTCESDLQTHMWFCNPEGDSHALPQETLLLLMMIPILYSTVAKSPKFRYSVITWCASVIMIIIGICVGNHTKSLPALVFYVPFSYLIIAENNRQNVTLLESMKHQDRLLAENIRYAEDQQTELRHMIANVAHDLKTPLSAFMNGVEVISSEVNSIVEKLHVDIITSTDATANSSKNDNNDNNNNNENKSNYNSGVLMMKSFHHIQESVKSLVNTNSFMVMTINRCIDYTKASKGLKLEARLETVDLLDILMLPINCMRDMQTRVSITLTALPSTICSHIITDKQWLQENIFCLTSNAVKYSSGITDVTITVSQITSKDLSGTASCGRILNAANNNNNNNNNNNVNNINSNSISPSNVNSHINNSNKHNRADLSEGMSSSKYYHDYSDSVISSHYMGTNHHNNDNRRASVDLFSTGFDASIVSYSNRSPVISPRGGGNSHRHNNHSNKFFDFVQAKSSKYSKKDSRKVYVTVDFAESSAKQQYSGHSNSNSNSGNNNNKNYNNNHEQQQHQEGAEQQLLLFEVEDTGIGLSNDVMATLFSPFRQAQRRAGGTGLGLYSLAKRVEALDGYYGVRKREDGKQGSLFWFAVPYVPDTSAESVLATVSEKIELKPSMTFSCDSKSSKLVAEKAITVPLKSSPRSTSNNNSISINSTTTIIASPNAHPKLHILLVDDSLTILKMTTSLLKRHGHFVTQAENGAEALAKLAERATSNGGTGKALPPFDVVLMDLNMPVMDGLEATTRLRATENNLECKSLEPRQPASPMSSSQQPEQQQHQFVVGFSANSDHQTMTEAYAAGVDDFICKPFALQTFYDVCQKHNQQGKITSSGNNKQ